MVSVALRELLDLVQASVNEGQKNREVTYRYSEYSRYE